MRIPIICLDTHLDQFLRCFRPCFSQPQYKYFVTILLGLMLCQSGRTLSGILRQVGAQVSLSGTSRFLSQAPWSVEEVGQTWQTAFWAEMVPLVEAEHARQKANRPRRRGRPRKTVVTGYLIGDDSVMQKMRGKKMGGLSSHYSSMAEKTVKGHCLVQTLYVLLGRQCPLEPQMYSQRVVCEQEGVTFQSKVDIMIATIKAFVPVPGTQTHVLLDSWYTAKKLWKAARERGFLITSGLRCNRQIRIDDPTTEKGWRWQRVDEYAKQLTETDFTKVQWPSQSDEREMYVHVVSSRIKKLYCCQVIFVREKLDGKTKYWASSDLEADMKTLIAHIAQRWDIEVLFADVKELLGIDQYQLMGTQSIRRFWVLVMVAYCFLEQERARLQLEQGCHVTLGDAWRETQRVHWCHFIDWLYESFTKFGYVPAELYAELTVSTL